MKLMQRMACLAALAAFAAAPAMAQENQTTDLNELKKGQDELRTEMQNLRKEVEQLRVELRKTLADVKTAQAQPTRARNRRQQPQITSCDVTIGDSPVRGAKDGKVTVTEFASFTCGWCMREEPTLQKVMKAYPNDVKVVYKNFPRNAIDMRLHAAAVFAKQEKGDEGFWAMHDKIIANPKNREVSDLAGYAEDIGIDKAKFEKFMSDESNFAKLFTDDRSQASKCGVRGTPTIVINGKRLQGQRTFENYKAMIDEALKGGDKAADAKKMEKKDT